MCLPLLESCLELYLIISGFTFAGVMLGTLNHQYVYLCWSHAWNSQPSVGLPLLLSCLELYLTISGLPLLESCLELYLTISGFTFAGVMLGTLNHQYVTFAGVMLGTLNHQWVYLCCCHAWNSI